MKYLKEYLDRETKRFKRASRGYIYSLWVIELVALFSIGLDLFGCFILQRNLSILDVILFLLIAFNAIMDGIALYRVLKESY